MKTLYVGCALRGAPPEFVQSVADLKTKLESLFSVLHFIGLSPIATAKDIYETDINCAAEADLMLAIADVPSTGLGIELAKRAELGKATIIAYHRDVDLSRMVLGLVEATPAFNLCTYTELDGLVAVMKTHA